VEGKAYYFPSFLKMCIENPSEVDTLPRAMLSCFEVEDEERILLVSKLTVSQRLFLLKYFERTFTEKHYSEVLREARDVLSRN